MATILIDAKVYTVDDEEALHRGVACEHFNGGIEPIWSTNSENYMEAKVVSERIKGRRCIRRSRVPLEKDDVFMDDPYKDRVDIKIIGLSKDVHQALGWHVETFDSMERELDICRDRISTLNSQLNNANNDSLFYKKMLEELQSLSLWGRIIRVFKGY